MENVEMTETPVTTATDDPAVILSDLDFALKMIELGEAKAKVETLEAELTPYVLSKEITQSIGDTVAKFSAGRNSFDWVKTARLADHETFESFTEWKPEETVTTVIPSRWEIDYQGICKKAKIDPIIAKPAVPSVTFSRKK